MKVKLNERGLLIGQESGGIAGGSNSGIQMRLHLPNTRGVVLIPLVAAHYQVGNNFDLTAGLIPDIPVEWIEEDLQQGNDPVLQIAETWIRRQIN